MLRPNQAELDNLAASQLAGTQSPVQHSSVLGSGEAIGRPLYLIVGEHRESPCDHALFSRFQIWVAQTVANSSVEQYHEGGANIVHVAEKARTRFPHLLNPCECGTYLPLAGLEPGPMLSSALSLQAELQGLRAQPVDIAPEFETLLAALVAMTDRCIDKQLALEIR